MFYSFRCPAKSRHVCGNSTGLNSASIPWHSRGGRCPLFCRGLVVGIAQNCWEIGGRGRFYDRREYVNVEITHRGYLYLLVYPEMSMCPNPYSETLGMPLQYLCNVEKAKIGKIDIESLRETCLQFNLPLSRKYLELLMEYCDANCDGYIDYVEFANFLNWKDSMPTGLPAGPGLRISAVILLRCNCTLRCLRFIFVCLLRLWKSGFDLSRCSQLAEVPLSDIQLCDGIPVLLVKQVDKPGSDMSTTSSLINGIVGGVCTKSKWHLPAIIWIFIN